MNKPPPVILVERERSSIRYGEIRHGAGQLFPTGIGGSVHLSKSTEFPQEHHGGGGNGSGATLWELQRDLCVDASVNA
ncbi:hypothetical protein M0804_004120 [Polistes exclamans]|nr:hypothetical protein M0804_004120 [Polistes exclamans]